MTDVNRIQVKLEAEIEGAGSFEVVSYQSQWALNTVPSATVVLAIGRNAADGQTAAAIHSKLSSIQKLNRVKIYATISGDWTPGIPWPEEPTVIFEGRVMGLGFLKNMGSTGFTLHLVHWLCDLDFSSSLAAYSHPSNPMDFTFQAVMSSMITTDGTSPNGIAQTAEAASISAGAIQEDLWAKAIKPFFCNLAAAEHVLPHSSLQTCAGLVSARNEAALYALAKIEGESSEFGLERSCYTPPASFNVTGNVSTEIAAAIASAIQSESQSSFAYSTIWGKLVGQYAPEFLLAVVPQAEKALVVPYTPALNQLYCKKIAANDYISCELQANISRPLRAVMLLNHTSTVTNVVAGQVITSVAGCYSPESDFTDQGVVRIGSVPRWLAGVSSCLASAGRTTGIKGRVVPSTSTTPGSGPKPDLKGNSAGHTFEEILISARDIHNNLAHAIYVNDALAGRMGTLFGKLRFDIGPGSIVAIEGTSERFLSVDEAASTLVAAVAEVSVGINAETSMAGTGYRLTHIRTINENNDERTAIGAHPLYTTVFKGAPLVDAYQFPEGDCC